MPLYNFFTGTIRDNLKWGNPNATDKEIARSLRCGPGNLLPWDLPNGLDTQLDEGGTNVSGGQKQRICIARALLKNPKILILDDLHQRVRYPHGCSLIRQALETEHKDVTKFIIAQRVLSVKDCDTILVMNEGKIVASGHQR